MVVVHHSWFMVSTGTKKRGTAFTPHLRPEALRKPIQKDIEIQQTHAISASHCHFFLFVFEISQVSSLKTEAQCFINYPRKFGL